MIDRTKLSLLVIFSAFVFAGSSSLPSFSASAAGRRDPDAYAGGHSIADGCENSSDACFAAKRDSRTAGRPEVRRGRVGVKIVSLNTGKTVYEQDADKYFMPASNMKNFTIATAMEKLGPDYQIRNSRFRRCGARC